MENAQCENISAKFLLLIQFSKEDFQFEENFLLDRGKHKIGSCDDCDIVLNIPEVDNIHLLLEIHNEDFCEISDVSREGYSTSKIESRSKKELALKKQIIYDCLELIFQIGRFTRVKLFPPGKFHNLSLFNETVIRKKYEMEVVEKFSVSKISFMTFDFQDQSPNLDIERSEFSNLICLGNITLSSKNETQKQNKKNRIPNKGFLIGQIDLPPNFDETKLLKHKRKLPKELKETNSNKYTNKPNSQHNTSDSDDKNQIQNSLSASKDLSLPLNLRSRDSRSKKLKTKGKKETKTIEPTLNGREVFIESNTKGEFSSILRLKGAKLSEKLSDKNTILFSSFSKSNLIYKAKKRGIKCYRLDYLKELTNGNDHISLKE